MSKLILAIDQGTTSSRAIIFNEESESLTSSYKNCIIPSYRENDGEGFLE